MICMQAPLEGALGLWKLKIDMLSQRSRLQAPDGQSVSRHCLKTTLWETSRCKI